uniref:Uncharacterized protein n=1 Tax=Ficedula albicollis TaxID=59894 RepID=A0A803WET0_FICAL
MPGIVVPGVSGAGPDGGGGGAAVAAAAAGLRPARRLHRPSGRRLVRAGAAPGPLPVPLLLPVPSGVSRCRLAGTVPEEPRCTVERADASLTYSLFLQRFAFSRPVILGGVTDNSVSAGRAQTVPGGTHLPVPRERRPHPAPRSPSRRRSEPSAPGRSCWRRSGPSRCGSARPTPTRTAKVSGGPRPAAGSRFPRSPLRSRSGCAVPGVRGAPAEAAGPGPAGQRHPLLLRGQQLHRVGAPLPALRAPSLPHPGHQPRLQLRHRRLRLRRSLPLARPWFLRGDFRQEGEN